MKLKTCKESLEGWEARYGESCSWSERRFFRRTILAPIYRSIKFPGFSAYVVHEMCSTGWVASKTLTPTIAQWSRKQIEELKRLLREGAFVGTRYTRNVIRRLERAGVSWEELHRLKTEGEVAFALSHSGTKEVS